MAFIIVGIHTSGSMVKGIYCIYKGLFNFVNGKCRGFRPKPGDK
jgi:hypothetical protein